MRLLERFGILRFVPQGCEFGSFYRLAYLDWTRGGCVAAPIGLHFAVMIIRRIWEWSYWRPGCSRREAELLDAWRTGYYRGILDRQDMEATEVDAVRAAGFLRSLKGECPMQHTTLRKLLFNPILRLFGWRPTGGYQEQKE